MKKVVAFLLVLFIFVAPVTTFVKADVVIGDNDETIINENATIIGRKLALMESLSDLALSGVTEFTISNANDVDSYLDYLWGEIDAAIESLSDGTGFTEISDTLKSKYFTNLVQYKDYITNRGNYLSQLLPTGSPTTSLLSTFFADNIFGKQTTQHYDLALDMFRSLSQFRGDNNQPQPVIPNDYNWFADINDFYLKDKDCFTEEWQPWDYTDLYCNFYYPLKSYTFVLYDWSSYNGFINFHHTNNSNTTPSFCIRDKLTIYLTSNNDNSINVTYSPTLINYKDYQELCVNYTNATFNTFEFMERYVKPFYFLGGSYQTSSPDSYESTYSSLTVALNDIYKKFCNIELYYNGELWVSTGNVVINNPTLDIDGYLKIYGNDNPQQYELQPNTKIDYDELYTTIYNAIRNNLPISQGDINYYDSHDNIYSPTIINNYGEEEGDESDLIDTILDYAVIPKFDTAIAQPMRQALTNGVVIMQNSITNVIPNEILLILGACFFLLLFAVVINRMIK